MRTSIFIGIIALLLLAPCAAFTRTATAAEIQPAQDAAKPAGYTEIMRSQPDYQDILVYRWREFPSVYIIHFENYELQGLTLNRVAAYVEKVGLRGRVASWRELAQYLRLNNYTSENFYSAHDYRTADLARFFNAVKLAGQPPSAEEQDLLDILQANQLLEWNVGRQQWEAAGSHALLSFATCYVGQDRPSSLVLGGAGRDFEAHALYHEMRHGLYFTQPEYAKACREYWKSVLKPDQKKAFRLTLLALDYDAADEELMINEWQAYLQTPPCAYVGVNALTNLMRQIATGERSPTRLSYADLMFLKQQGLSVAGDVEQWMAADLRAWLGGGFNVPDPEYVQAFADHYRP